MGRWAASKRNNDGLNQGYLLTDTPPTLHTHLGWSGVELILDGFPCPLDSFLAVF